MKKFISMFFATLAIVFTACQSRTDTATVNTNDNVTDQVITDPDQFSSYEDEIVPVTPKTIVLSELNTEKTSFRVELKFSGELTKVIQFTRTNSTPVIAVSNDNIVIAVSDDIPGSYNLLSAITTTPENLEVYMLGTTVMKIVPKGATQAIWEIKIN